MTAGGAGSGGSGGVDPVDPSSLHVSGGAGGVEADYADMAAEARLLAATSEQLATTAASLHRDLLDPDVALSAVLDPGGAARYEALLAEALDGPSGLTVKAVGSLAHADLVRASAWAYQEADEAGRRLMDGLLWSGGVVAGVTAPVWAPLALGAAAVDKALGGDPAAQLQDVLTHHAGLVSDLADAAPGLIDGVLTDVPILGPLLPKLPPTGPGQGAALLGALWPDGHGTATPTGDPTASAPPTSVQSLLDHLDRRAQAADAQHGSIDVQQLTTTGPDGRPQTRWIVDVPGTSAWPGPGHYDNATDVGTNLHSMAGERTAYEQGIEQAMARAGIPPDDPVMLVGHSQGGMVAVQTANDLVTHGRYHVTDVVTAGSPVGRMPVPPSVHVLSLENSDDIVPALEGAPNDASPNHVTVTFDRQNGSIGGNHSIPDAYEPGAAAVDASTDPSVVAWREQAAGWFGGTAATTRAYRVTRQF